MGLGFLVPTFSSLIFFSVAPHYLSHDAFLIVHQILFRDWLVLAHALLTDACILFLYRLRVPSAFPALQSGARASGPLLNEQTSFNCILVSCHGLPKIS